MASLSACTSAAVMVADAAGTFFFDVLGAAVCATNPVASNNIAQNVHADFILFFSFFVVTNDSWSRVLSDLLDGFLLFGNHVIRKRSVGQSGGHLLAVGHHPVEEIVQDFPLGRVF